MTDQQVVKEIRRITANHRDFESQHLDLAPEHLTSRPDSSKHTAGQAITDNGTETISGVSDFNQ